MTRSRYLLARIAQAFGLSLQARYASSAASELHLLREAEEVLGRLSWEELENFEELSMEYWNLRKLSKRFTAISNEMEQANALLQVSHEERVGLLEKVVDSTKDLVAQREALVTSSERLDSERDAIIREARLVKRRHDGLKAKFEVLTQESADNELQIEATRSELDLLRNRFEQLKNRRAEVANRIEEVAREVAELDETISARRKDLREETFGSYQSIGKANRDISSFRAELGGLEKEMTALFCQIGHYISLHHHDENCRAVTRQHRGLIHQMTALRESVSMNHRLAGRAPLTS